MTPPLVSVCMPAYNAMPYLPTAVASVLDQTYDNLELIVVDDGSIDDSVAWLEQVTDTRVICIQQQNSGAASARNQGIRAARGKYIAFIDADDHWVPTKLERQVARAEEARTPTLVDTWAYLINASGDATGQSLCNIIEGDVWALMVQLQLVFHGSSTMLVPRVCFETAGLFREDLHHAEDWELWIRLTRLYPLAVVRQPLAAYRQHPGGKHHNHDGLLAAMLRIVDITFQDAAASSRRLRRRAKAAVHLHVASRMSRDPDQRHRAARLATQAVTLHPRLLMTRRCAVALTSGAREVIRARTTVPSSG